MGDSDVNLQRAGGIVLSFASSRVAVSLVPVPARAGMPPGCSPFHPLCPCRAAADPAGCSMIMGCSPRY